jgi:hypothetical protein
MSHSLQFKILTPLAIFIVFFTTSPVLAESSHASHNPQPAASSPQVLPALVLPPTAAITQNQPADTTDSGNQDNTAPSEKQMPMQSSIYSDLADMAAAQARQEKARQQLSPSASPVIHQPAKPAARPATPVATMPIKTPPVTHVWSYIPFINAASLSANAYDGTNGLSARTTKLLTYAAYGMIVAGILLVAIKPKNSPFLSATFKKPVSSI